MMVFNGEQSRVTTEALAKQQHKCVRRPLLAEPMEFVKQQASLGTAVTPAAQGPEMRGRSSNAMASRGPLRKEILPRPHMPQYKKVLYNDASTNSRPLFNCRARNALTDGEHAMLET